MITTSKYQSTNINVISNFFLMQLPQYFIQDSEDRDMKDSLFEVI